MNDDSDTVLSQFGERAGLAGLIFDSHDQVVFRSATTAYLMGLERTEREILVYVTMLLNHDAGEWLMRAYQQAHHVHSGQWPVQPALREIDSRRHLLVLTRLPRNEFIETRLQHTFSYLTQWLDKLREKA